MCCWTHHVGPVGPYTYRIAEGEHFRCQCQCGGSTCLRRATQEDMLCDVCREPALQFPPSYPPLSWRPSYKDIPAIPDSVWTPYEQDIPVLPNREYEWMPYEAKLTTGEVEEFRRRFREAFGEQG
jgi:hypothetical protein